MVQIRRGEGSQAQTACQGGERCQQPGCVLALEGGGEERSQEGEVAGTGVGLSAAAGMDLATCRLWVRGA